MMWLVDQRSSEERRGLSRIVRFFYEHSHTRHTRHRIEGVKGGGLRESLWLKTDVLRQIDLSTQAHERLCTVALVCKSQTRPGSSSRQAPPLPLST